MYTKHNGSTHTLRGVFLFFIGLFFVVGCSEQTASKPPEAAVPQKVTTAQKPAKSAPSKPSQVSSLEALQKGTLGKGAKEGPLRDVNFDFDRYDVRPDMRDILKGHAAWLKANPQVRVEVEGHCDERGTSEYNLALGAKRAESVKRYLIDLGISPDRLSTISYGEELPMCKEQNEACWAKDRRAHFVVRAGPTT
ncbi:MAG: peptidoglycan-associated lipoprotein Pal [Deltaproteobacteria bacterium]|nr:peptidoglycan-associated lipoprotein Pal [Deltaproteobacteria bacterium]MBI2530848.1 peptidoglycan-associated lipoprotein Pal [Deltaproteobacteria bacterium]